MIQFNLLPDVKLEYIKAKQTKRTAVLASIAVCGVTISVLALLFVSVNVLQKKHLSDLNKDIKTYSTQLNNTKDLNKILTIQNQLNSLPGLHDDKVVGSRLFTYITQVTPANATISKFDIDFTANTMTITGTADNLGTINKFADTLKFTKYKTADGKEGNAFSNVVLTTFSRDSSTASYQLNLQFDPVIFNGAQDVTLTTPKIISTRSETEKPSDLFQSGTGQ